VKLIYFYFGEPRIIYGSAGPMALRGHEVYVVEPNHIFKGSSDRSTLEIEVGIWRNTKRVQLNILNLNQYNILDMVEIFSKINPDVLITGHEYWLMAKRIAKNLKKPLVTWHIGIPTVFNLSPYLRGRMYSQIFKAPIGLVYNILLAYFSDYVLTTNIKTEQIYNYVGIRKIKTILPSYPKFMRKDEYARFFKGSNFIVAPTDDLPLQYVLAFATITINELHYKYQLKRLYFICEIAKKMPDVNFVIIGTSKSDIGGAFRYEGLNNLFLLGKVFDDSCLAKLYEKAYCVVCPVLDSGFPTHLFEAFFYGKAIVSPSVATKCYEGLKHGTNILLCENTTEAVKYIKKIIREDKIRIMLEENARKYYIEYFSPEKHAKELEQVLKSII